MSLSHHRYLEIILLSGNLFSTVPIILNTLVNLKHHDLDHLEEDQHGADYKVQTVTMLIENISLYYFPWQEALDSWLPAVPVIKKEVLLPSMAGLDSWGRLRRLHGDQRSLARTVDIVRSEFCQANTQHPTLVTKYYYRNVQKIKEIIHSRRNKKQKKRIFLLHGKDF